VGGQITWHPFFLDPTLPVDGVDKQARYREKFGPRIGPMLDNMTRIGPAVRAFGRPWLSLTRCWCWYWTL
jgi:predicted DsbA family dithiol-disulfide isomerase